MVAQVKAWGNSQGIRLSKELLALAGIQNNDLLEIELIEGGIVLKKTKKEHRTLEERAKEFGGQLGPYEEFDWGDPEGRERW
ncbi:MAG: AbrB/MazE/SpoVT family DNA-binding domain-containing protein [Lachnospiraceae bacterium]|jgi:antitoxin MazE|uniref:AbrB/MazE/SpoVT family DNA-binding domain-containing protein n=1 Tax=Candidatus Merdisoma sp. JLR.KK006 TaxID=3112626 RepID=UPI002FF1D5B3|nr:AbrB/MazE/SpoVT family DNA-binding domain-containing protein [Lachnospiraceae bacterium]